MGLLLLSWNSETVARFPGWSWRGFSSGLPGWWRAYRMCSLRTDSEELGLLSLGKSRLTGDVVATLKPLKRKYKISSARDYYHENSQRSQSAAWRFTLGIRKIVLHCENSENSEGLWNHQNFQNVTVQSGGWLHRITELLRLVGNSGGHLVHPLHFLVPKHC